MKPNILFFFPDQHRGDWVPYDDSVFAMLQTERPPIHMPNLRRLMETGMSFSRCITPSPLCAPARACLASGSRYENCRVSDNNTNYPVDMQSFYGLLRDAGYSVGGVGKFDLHKSTLFWGLDGWVDDLGKIGFTTAVDSEGKWDGVSVSKQEPKGPYFQYLYANGLAGAYLSDMAKRSGAGGQYNTDPTTLPDSAYGDTWIGENGVEMLRRFPQQQPWFLQVNFSGPHDPWDITEAMKRRWENVQFPKAERGEPEKESQVNAIRQNYAAMLENIDAQMGRMLDEVRRRGELENTLIVYASDHGEMLGDLAKLYKQVPDRASVHVPLVVWGGDVRQGGHSEALVELQDLSATFLDYAGLAERFGEALSLRPVLSGKTEAHRESMQSALGDWKAVYDARYKTVYRSGEPTEQYSYADDPWERENLLERDGLET